MGLTVIWRAAVGLLLAGVLTGCQVPGAGSENAPTPGTSGETSDGRPGEPRRTIPPQLLECGAPDAGNKGAGEEQIDLTDARVAADARWTIPAGYTEAGGYYDDLAYERQTFLITLVPDDPGYDTLDLLGIIGYEGLDWGDLARECGQVPVAAMLERVQQYQDTLGSEALNEPQVTEVAGLPAVTQDMRIPNYDFRGYWLFSQTELLFLGCQWTSGSARPEIERSCRELVESVVVG
ncbi:hypothetical protein [Ruania rhizosphaerae]|uniref:hypothetical protein n=1 Tax=Ruania rhizosphaerae TaxID=1840413 RepID=UPI00135B7FAD|nr:hypothetical protein [Ruania rhizosphaerae]